MFCAILQATKWFLETLTEIYMENLLKNILGNYQNSFIHKVYTSENNDVDLLMDAFGVTPELKRENRQYWGRELGMCWQLLVTELFKNTRDDFGTAVKIGADEPCDLTAGTYAIDTKYRIGSGDSGTLKKFKSYGPKLKEMGYSPLFLIVREDNLPAAINACRVGEWTVLTGKDTFKFIRNFTNFDLEQFLLDNRQCFKIDR